VNSVATSVEPPACFVIQSDFLRRASPLIMLTQITLLRPLIRNVTIACGLATLCLGIGVSALGQANVPRHRLLLDGSGSMQGFFSTSQLQELHRLLGAVFGDGGESYYFVDNDLIPAHVELTKFGDNTYLKNALDRAVAQKPAPAILWLVTDNQPSAGNQTSSDQDIVQFYEALRSDVVKRLYFFPLRLNFAGKLYRDDGHTVLTPKYEGPRGLLVYAMLLDEAAREEFERATTEFQSAFQKSKAGEMRRILIKPLEQDTITAELVAGEKFRVENGNHLVAGDFAEGAPIKGQFKIQLTSQLGQMNISKADIDVSVREKFSTGDFTESEIKPDFNPTVINDFGPKNTQPINVDIKAPGVHIRNNLLSWWNCITHKRGDITGNIQIAVNVPSRNFDVVSALTKDFSTQGDIYQSYDAGVQSKIFKLDDLVKKMMPERAVSIRPRIGNGADGSIPVRMTVLYPSWPVFALILLVLGLLFLLWFAWRFFGKQPLYRLTWDGGRFRQCADFPLYPFGGRSIELDNRIAARIKRTLGGVRVNAAKGYTIDEGRGRIINSSGTDFNVSHAADGAGVNFYFSSVTAAFGGSATRNDSGSILEGMNYGEADDGADGLRAGSGPAPPVRKATTRVSGERQADADATDLDLDSL
jgi:hypothetical protein